MAINSSPLKIDERCFSDISDASSTASSPRNIRRPIVNAKKKVNAFLPSFLMNGYHKRPIIIGTTPMRNPIIPKNKNKSTFGSNEANAASTSVVNLVPSSIVIPISYG